VHADYLIARYIELSSRLRPSVITYVLRFPLCTPSVLAALLERPSYPHPPAVQSSPSTDALTNTGTPRTSRDHHNLRYFDPDYVSAPPELPRRLFRQLSASGAEALPHLHFLYTSSAPQLSTRRPDIDSHDGYPLVRAASAGAVPLVRFLLDHGATHRRDALAVRLAINRRELSLVRLLIEPPDAPPDELMAGKRRKLADRIKVTSEMLRLAVLYGAQDIAEYFMNEKGCVPDIRTLSFLK
jgi:hypothetical protein